MKRVLVAAAALVALTACHYVGNGYITSKTGMGQAQFTFDINCPPGQNYATGSLTYVDDAAGVRIRGVPGEQFTLGYGCFTNGDGLSEASFSGTYQAVNRQGGTGSFDITVKPSPNNQANGGTFTLTLTGGPNAGYTNSGPVTGHIKAVGGSGA